MTGRVELPPARSVAGRAESSSGSAFAPVGAQQAAAASIGAQISADTAGGGNPEPLCPPGSYRRPPVVCPHIDTINHVTVQGLEVVMWTTCDDCEEITWSSRRAKYVRPRR